MENNEVLNATVEAAENVLANNDWIELPVKHKPTKLELGILLLALVGAGACGYLLYKGGKWFWVKVIDPNLKKKPEAAKEEPKTEEKKPEAKKEVKKED